MQAPRVIKQRKPLQTNKFSNFRSNNMEARTEHQLARRFNILFYGTSLLGMVDFALVLIWVFVFRGGLGWSSTPNLQFNWHPLLMLAGMILLYGQAILLYRSRRYDVKKRLKWGHALLNGTAFIFAVIGLVAVFDFHNLTAKPNMYTLHSWLGLATVIAFALQFVAGFSCFLFPGFAKEVRAAMLPVHTSVGTAIFSLASMTTLMGFTEKACWGITNYDKFPPEGYLVNFIAVLTALFCVLVLYLVNEKEYKRDNIPEDEVALTRSE